MPGKTRILLVLLLIFGGAEFVVRGPVRVVKRATSYNDYTSTYVGAKAWMKGLNPYSNDVFWSLWKDPSGQPQDEVESIGSRTPYPWTCFLILAPFSLLGPVAANIAVGLSFSALILLSIWLLSSLPALASDAPRRWLFIALCLALSPFHSGLGQVNISMGAIAFVFLSFWAASKNKPAQAGLFCALSVCLKPPIGAFLAVFYLLKRQWREFGIAVGVSAALTAIAVGRLQIAGVPWLSAYLANSKLVLTDPLNVMTDVNLKRFQMVNLQVLWYAITHSERVANFLALAVGAAFFLALAYALSRNKEMRLAPLEISALVVVSLLPIYHRFYDASLLALPLLWALSPETPKLNRRLALFLLIPFAVPGAWALENLQNAGRLPVRLTDQWWWTPVVLSHQVWALLALSSLLVAANFMKQRRLGSVSAPCNVTSAVRT